jgi:integrase
MLGRARHWARLDYRDRPRLEARVNRIPSERDLPDAVSALVEHSATKAGLPHDRRSPHVLRRTLCTLLADAGAGL